MEQYLQYSDSEVQAGYQRASQSLGDYFSGPLLFFCKYSKKYREEIKNQVIQVVKVFPYLYLHDCPFHESHLFDHVLLILKGKLPIIQNNIKYDLKIEITLPKDFPQQPPVVKFVNAYGIGLQLDNILIDDEGYVDTQYCRHWRQQYSDLLGLCKHLIQLLLITPPPPPDIPSPRNIQPARKLALIIGNNAYNKNPEKLPELFNCVRDAQLMDTTLTKLGFKTTLLTDRTHDEIILEVKNFSRQIREKDIVFFYYSGHAGQQSKNNREENYLFGIDADFEQNDENNITLRGVRLNRDIIGEFYEECIYLIVIDACRVFPQEHERYKCIGGDSNKDFGSLPKNIQERSLGNYKLPDNIGRAQFDVVFACEPGKFAIEDSSMQNSYLAKSLSRSLSRREFWADVLIDVKKEVYEETGGRQYPSILTKLRLKLNLAKAVVNKQNIE